MRDGRRRVVAGLGALGAAAFGGRDAVTAEAAPPRRLLRRSDIRFLGAARFPTEVAGDDASWGFGLAHRRVGGELRLISAAARETVYEVRVPGWAAGPPYPAAEVVRVWGDVTQGRKRLDPPAGRNAGLMGLYWDQPTRRLLWSYGDAYNTHSAHDPSLGASRLDDGDGSVEALGAWRLGNRSCKTTMGGVLAVPRWFADRHCGGRRLAAGFGGYFSIATIGPVSMGPALTAFSPEDLGRIPDGGTLPVDDLVGYPFNATAYTQPDRCRRDADYRTEYDGWNPREGTGYWTWSDYLAQAGAWIETPAVQGVLFCPTLGNGRVWYEASTLHAERASHAWLVYGPADLAQVAAGRRRPWEIQPRRILSVRYPGLDYPLAGWADGPSHHVVGVTFDPVRHRLYVAVRRPWSPGVEAGHLVSAYQVAA